MNILTSHLPQQNWMNAEINLLNYKVESLSKDDTLHYIALTQEKVLSCVKCTQTFKDSFVSSEF